MTFNPHRVSTHRGSNRVVWVLLVLLGAAVILSASLPGVESPAGAVPAAVEAGSGSASVHRESAAAVGRTARFVATMVAEVIGAWWPIEVVLDWVDSVHRAWPTIHRLPGTNPGRS